MTGIVILSDSDLEDILLEMPDNAARKRWIVAAYCHELITPDQVAFLFYIYGLRHD